MLDRNRDRATARPQVDNPLRRPTAQRAPAPATRQCAARSRRAALERRKLLGRLRSLQRRGHLVEVAVEDELQLVERQVDAVVSDAPLREVVGADAVAAVAAADQSL